LKREDLIPYKDKNSNLFNSSILFKISFEKNFLNLENTISHAYNDAFKEHSILKNFNIKIINYNQPNISNLLIYFTHSLKNYSVKPRYLKCSNELCKTCVYSDSSYFINLNNFFLPFYCFSNCNTINCIYILKCTLCSIYYIGETSNFKKRLSSHISDINNFIPYKKSKCVSLHFNLLKHDYKHHLKFFIYHDNLEIKKERLNFETHLIFLFQKLSIKILNIKQTNYNSNDIYKLSYN